MEREWLRSGLLVPVLEEARRRGFLGPGPVEDHLLHSLGFVAAGQQGGHDTVVDLGSGGGVPGLILALAWPEARVILLDASERRANFLVTAVDQLGLAGSRVEVVRERAEIAGRQDGWRSTADVVVARMFGPPAVAAECAAPFLATGGRLIVSEPPEGGHGRWPGAGLEQLGLAEDSLQRHEGRWYRVLLQTAPCPTGFPRRVGLAAKRPLF